MPNASEPTTFAAQPTNDNCHHYGQIAATSEPTSLLSSSLTLCCVLQQFHNTTINHLASRRPVKHRRVGRGARSSAGRIARGGAHSSARSRARSSARSNTSSSACTNAGVALVVVLAVALVVTQALVVARAVATPLAATRPID